MLDLIETLQALQSWKVSMLAVSGLQLDLSTPHGKLLTGVLASLAEFERDLLIERTQAGLSRAKAEGKRLGRPMALTDKQQAEIAEKRQAGASLRALAKEYGTSLASLQRAEARAT